MLFQDKNTVIIIHRYKVQIIINLYKKLDDKSRQAMHLAFTYC